jgi:SAM-dependent methyltransferase
MMTASAAFDAIAPRYDELWTRSPAGLSQRRAVWRHVDPLFQPGQTILDIGCGTGEDARHFMDAGLNVHAIDVSPEMVRIARARGVDATCMPVEALSGMTGCFQGAISNFGVLNCVAGLHAISSAVAELLRPGSFLVLCLLGRFCLWETAWYLLAARPRKAFRRWKAASHSSSLGIQVSYPSVKNLQRALHPHFTLIQWSGIGLAVPPSYVRGLAPRIVHLFSSFDRRLAHLPCLRMLADHRLFVFVRK